MRQAFESTYPKVGKEKPSKSIERVVEEINRKLQLKGDNEQFPGYPKVGDFKKPYTSLSLFDTTSLNSGIYDSISDECSQHSSDFISLTLFILDLVPENHKFIFNRFIISDNIKEKEDFIVGLFKILGLELLDGSIVSSVIHNVNIQKLPKSFLDLSPKSLIDFYNVLISAFSVMLRNLSAFNKVQKK